MLSIPVHVPIPREHGAWAMLLTPLTLGMLILGPSVVGGLTGAGLVLLYMARVPLERTLIPRGRAGQRQGGKGWLSGFAAAGTLAFVPALLSGRGGVLLGALLPAGACLAAVWWLTARGQARLVLSGLLAATGLTAAGLTYWVAEVGALTPETFGVGALCLVFSGGSVFRVKAAARERFSWRFRVAGALLHLAGLLAVALLVRAGWLPPLTLAALLPASLRALLLVVREPTPGVRLRAVGLAELRHNLLFAAVTLLAFRWPM